MTIIAGIDPGARGGVAVLHAEWGRMIRGNRMPLIKHGKPRVDVQCLVAILQNVEIAIIEDVHAMPKQGVSSSFQFGRMFGMAEAAVMSMGLALERVTPAVWKKHYRLSRDKRASLDLATLRFPGRFNWSVGANEGVAEAALIANWWAERRGLHRAAI